MEELSSNLETFSLDGSTNIGVVSTSSYKSDIAQQNTDTESRDKMTTKEEVEVLAKDVSVA